MGLSSSGRALALAFTETSKVYVRPFGILHGHRAKRAVTSGQGLPLAGVAAFTMCEIVVRNGCDLRSEQFPTCFLAKLETAVGQCLHARVRSVISRLTAIRERTVLSRYSNPIIAGVVNVTPDSFSDGGAFFSLEKAIVQGRALYKAGAAFIDVGGESTRPGSSPITAEMEQNRVLPVVRALSSEGMPVSVDTYHGETMQLAVKNGAMIINDISALTASERNPSLVASIGVPVILMHSQRQNNDTVKNYYGARIFDVYDYLEDRLEVACAAGISSDKVILDPGLGFAKTPKENFEILESLGLLHGLGCPLMVGASRKFGKVSDQSLLKDRTGGSLAAALHAANEGVQIIRVHDVAETAQALGVWRAINGISR